MKKKLNYRWLQKQIMMYEYYRIVEKEGGGCTSDNEGSKFEKVFPPIIGLDLDWDCVDTFFSLGKFLETAVLLFLKVNIYDNMKPNL